MSHTWYGQNVKGFDGSPVEIEGIIESKGACKLRLLEIVHPRMYVGAAHQASRESYTGPTSIPQLPYLSREDQRP